MRKHYGKFPSENIEVKKYLPSWQPAKFYFLFPINSVRTTEYPYASQ